MTNKRYIVEALLYTSPHAEKILRSRFNAAHHIYNDFLGECERRRKKHISSADFKKGIEILKSGELSEELKEQKKELFQKSRRESGWYLRSAKQYGCNNSLEQYGSHIHKTWLSKHIDSHTRNSLMDRAFLASEKVMFGDKTKNKKTGKFERPKVRFKRFNKDYILSVQGKSAKSAIKLKGSNIHWLGLKLPIIMPSKDLRLKFIIDNPELTTFVRIKRELVKGRWQYFVQLSCTGVPIKKPGKKFGKGTVGADIGPSTIAYVSDVSVSLQTITSLDTGAFKKLISEQKNLQRKIDRQRRKNNPDNFNDNGTPKRGKKWVTSNRQKRAEGKLANLQRKVAKHRRCEHGILLNNIRSVGDKLLLDKDSYKGWQQSGYGRSIGRHAPGQLIMLAKQKFDLTGGEVKCINTNISKSSQTCPNCGHQEKKGKGKIDSRQVRIHDCSNCGYLMQRDLASALINKHTKDDNTLDVDKSKRFIMDKRPILQACIKRLIKSAREGQPLPSTFGTLSELERIACYDNESVR